MKNSFLVCFVSSTFLLAPIAPLLILFCSAGLEVAQEACDWKEKRAPTPVFKCATLEKEQKTYQLAIITEQQ